ncbi:MAG: hypothetical protein ACE5FM_08285 [Methyloligellaceae bacterium]
MTKRNQTTERMVATIVVTVLGALIVWVIIAAFGCEAPALPIAEVVRYTGLDDPEATEPPDGWAWCIVVRRSGRWSVGMYWCGGSEADPRYLDGVRWLAARGNQINLSAGQALELTVAASTAIRHGADPNNAPADPKTGLWSESVLVVAPSLKPACWRWGRAQPIE